MPKVVREADTLTNRWAVNRLRREKICRETGKCFFCPPHRCENAERHPRPDKYKAHRRKEKGRLPLRYI